jgi:molybdopterin-guanine dinucleotide biosynthesis protein A
MIQQEAPQADAITGVILAGGRARRLGGLDKGLMDYAGRPLVEWVIAALRPQVRTLIINANRNLERYRAYGWPVVSDRTADFQGPLAGIASALAVAETPYILTLPCDGPRPPADLGRRLCEALWTPVSLLGNSSGSLVAAGGETPTAIGPAEIAVASDGARLQPVHALIPTCLASSLDEFLTAGERRVDRWYARHRTAIADFSDQPRAFANINDDEDARRLALGQ